MGRPRLVHWWGLVAATCGFWMNAVLAVTFYRALRNGGEVLVSVKNYGELWYECIIVPISLLITASWLGYMISRHWRQ